MIIAFSVPSVTKVEIPYDDRADRIDSYFKSKGMPLAGYGHEFVEQADKNGIDWRLLPAISIKEQSGGLRKPYNCPNKTINYNWFGWASARICFHSIDEAIKTVSENLGGNNPRTQSYYKGDTREKLHSYNGTVDPKYPSAVIEIMEKF